MHVKIKKNIVNMMFKFDTLVCIKIIIIEDDMDKDKFNIEMKLEDLYFLRITNKRISDSTDQKKISHDNAWKD